MSDDIAYRILSSPCRSRARRNRNRGRGQSGVPAATAAPAFDPATLALSGWWRASFTASPWVGTASAGASLGRDMTEPTNPPTAGAALNGFTPAQFNGTTSRLASNVPTDFVSAATGGIGVLFRTNTTIPAQASSTWQSGDECMVADSFARVGIMHTDSGIRAGFYNGTVRNTTASIVCATGAYHWGFAWWTGGNMFCQLDGGAPVSVAIGGTNGPVFAAGALRMALQNAGLYDGRIAEVMTMLTAFSGTNIPDIIAYGNARYGLAL